MGGRAESLACELHESHYEIMYLLTYTSPSCVGLQPHAPRSQLSCALHSQGPQIGHPSSTQQSGEFNCLSSGSTQ